MMNERPLWPTLEIIENDLFGPSDDLIERWAADDPALPPDLRRALESDPEAREKRRLAAEPVVLDPAIRHPHPPLPAILREAVGRRVAARNAAFRPSPRVGQIVSVERLMLSAPGL
jgi:hypothetical protein